jgi:hypothetical protein
MISVLLREPVQDKDMETQRKWLDVGADLERVVHVFALNMRHMREKGRTEWTTLESEYGIHIKKLCGLMKGIDHAAARMSFIEGIESLVVALYILIDNS